MIFSKDNHTDETPFWAVSHIAERWHCSQKHVRRLIEKGELPHHRFGRSVRVSGDDLLRYERGQRRS